MSSEFFRSRLFTVVCLLATSWTIVATSKVGVNLFGGQVTLKSDCPGANPGATVTVTSNQITAPGSLSFTNFGFPNATLDPTSNENSGTVSGISRRCVRTVGDLNNGDDWIYSCYDAGAFVCNIYIRAAK